MVMYWHGTEVPQSMKKKPNLPDLLIEWQGLVSNKLVTSNGDKRQRKDVSSVLYV